MLITCPECELQVSDKALTCPHCGYPLKAESAPRQTGKKQNRRRRLPNGFGQISEIKGQNLRKPFRAMVSVGKSSTGRPICKLLTPEAYFATYNEAYAALVEYNKHPYEIASDITLKELYEKWSKKYYDGLSPSRIRAIQAAWKYCSRIYDVPAANIRPSHIEYCMEHGESFNPTTKKMRTPTVHSKDSIRTLLGMVLDYGIKNGIVDKNYAKMVSLSKADRKLLSEKTAAHMAFTPEELEILWKNTHVQYVDVILINCYMGWRPGELGDIKLENTNLDEWYCIGGKKTNAGKDRIVPIHPRIREFVSSYYNTAKEKDSEYLFYREAIRWNEDHRMNYETYANHFERIMKKLSLNPAHRPHDCRKTFVTMAKSVGMDEYAIKRIVGHKISDLTEGVYTERPLSWLASEIEKIK